jgi:tRNA-dihydrouridine synthase
MVKRNALSRWRRGWRGAAVNLETVDFTAAFSTAMTQEPASQEQSSSSTGEGHAYKPFLVALGLDGGSSRFVCAPMVLQSHLAFRTLVRRHGVGICYSPMLTAARFMHATVSEHYISARTCQETRESNVSLGATTAAGTLVYRFTEPQGIGADVGAPTSVQPIELGITVLETCTHDRPLVVQLAGNSASQLLAAARKVEPYCDAVDINLGCPQQCAARGNYGAFLLAQPVLVEQIVRHMTGNLSIPVTCKMRLLETFCETLAFAKMLEDSGVALITVHGRKREARDHAGPADWEQIRQLKSALAVPVIANGNVSVVENAVHCLQFTGCDAVMSATALLRMPRLFSDTRAATAAKQGSEPGGLAEAVEPEIHRVDPESGSTLRLL